MRNKICSTRFKTLISPKFLKMLEFLNEIDQEWLLYLNGLGNEEWDAFWLLVTNKWTSIPLYLSLLCFCLYLKKWKQTLVILLAVALLILCCDQCANLFKYGFERLRPCHNPLINNYLRIVTCGGKYGYFSAHAANSFAVAVFFYFLFRNKIRWIGGVLFSWAMLVSYSRLYLGVHYPFDILTGAMIGGGFGFLCYKITSYILNKKFKQDNLNN